MTAIGITNGFLFKRINTYIMDMNVKQWNNWGIDFFYIGDAYEPGLSAEDIPMYFVWDKIKQVTLANKDDSEYTNTARHLFDWTHKFMKEIGLEGETDLYADSIVLYWEGG